MLDLKFYKKTERPWVNHRLTNAAIVGHTTPSSTRLWVRAWEEDKNKDGASDSGEGVYWLMVTEHEIDGTGRPEILQRGGQPRVFIDGQEVATKALKPISLKFETDLTGVVDIEDLDPGRRYYYALFAGFKRSQRWEVGSQSPLSFRTLSRDPDRVSFGVFSCHQPFKKGNLVRSEMWSGFFEALTATGASYVIGTGDQVYVDGVGEADIWKWLRKHKDDKRLKKKTYRKECMDSWYRDVYRGFWGDNNLRNVFAAFPTYMIWDDHEIMDGWGALTKKEARAQLNKHAGKKSAYYDGLMKSMFKAAQRIYMEYQHGHNPPTPEKQWDYAFSAGLVATYVLDGRGHRDFGEGKPGERVHGGRQLARFLAWLESPVARSAAAVFVVCAVPLIHHRSWIVNRFDRGGLKDDLRDQWEHSSNRRERRVILDAVGRFSNRAGTPVVFLSGDVHMSAAFRLTQKGAPKARVYQLTSSGITYSGSARVPSIPFFGNRLGDYAVPNHGYVARTGKTWSFEGIQEVIEKQNFALVHCVRRPTGGVDLTWDIYGARKSAPGWVKHPSVKLD